MGRDWSVQYTESLLLRGDPYTLYKLVRRGTDPDAEWRMQTEGETNRATRSDHLLLRWPRAEWGEKTPWSRVAKKASMGADTQRLYEEQFEKDRVMEDARLREEHDDIWVQRIRTVSEWKDSCNALHLHDLLHWHLLGRTRMGWTTSAANMRMLVCLFRCAGGTCLGTEPVLHMTHMCRKNRTEHQHHPY